MTKRKNISVEITSQGVGISVFSSLRLCESIQKTNPGPSVFLDTIYNAAEEDVCDRFYV